MVIFETGSKKEKARSDFDIQAGFFFVVVDH
jgi:hypothetical protein